MPTRACRTTALLTFLLVTAAWSQQKGQQSNRIDLGTHKLNLVCTGSSSATPAVVFEAGGGGSSASWKSVFAELPSTIRACAYDRAGSGQSDPGPQPRSMPTEVHELHSLLTAAKIPTPIVFVGHSLAGVLARIFAQDYPNALAAILLLDPTHEDDLVFNTKVNRWLPVRELEDTLGAGARLAATTPKPFANLPLTIIGSGKRLQPPGTSEAQWTQMRTARDQRVASYRNFSDNSTFRFDPQSTHNIPQDNPKLVVTAILDLIAKTKQ